MLDYPLENLPPALARFLNKFALPILLLLALLLGLAQLADSVSITNDTATFIHFARQMSGELPVPALRQNPAFAPAMPPALLAMQAQDQHPGFPAVILLLHHFFGEYFSSDPSLQWIYSARAAAFPFGLLLVAALFLFTDELFGCLPAAIVILALLTVPPLEQMRVDALSDAPALAMLVLSAFFAARTLARPVFAAPIFCGLAAGAGYLFRPEALQVAIATLAFLAARTFFSTNRPARRTALLQCIALLLPLIALCLPYMLIKGSILTKEQAIFAPAAAGNSYFAGHATANLAAFHFNFLAYLHGLRTVLFLWALNLAYFLFAVLLIGFFVVWKTHSKNPTCRLIGLVALANILLLPAIFARKGYLDFRHLLPMVYITAPFLWPGLLAIGAAVWKLTSGLYFRNGLKYQRLSHSTGPTARLGNILLWLHTRLKPDAPRVAFTIAVVFSTLLVPVDFRRPLHAERIGFRLAGQYLRGKVASGQSIVDPENISALYADLDGQNDSCNGNAPLSPLGVAQYLFSNPQARYLIFSDRYLEFRGLPLPPVNSPLLPGFPISLHPAADFPLSMDTKDPHRVRVLQVVRQN